MIQTIKRFHSAVCILSILFFSFFSYAEAAETRHNFDSTARHSPERRVKELQKALAEEKEEIRGLIELMQTDGGACQSERRNLNNV